MTIAKYSSEQDVALPTDHPVLPVRVPFGSAGGSVEACQESDIPEVAAIHHQVFHGKDTPAPERLKDYYREVFFRNPWPDADLPSLVYRTATGEVVGFMGRIARPMSFRGRRIRLAIAHRLMVKADSGHPIAAVRLVRKFLAGPQDISFSDGANDKGRQFWEGAGGSTLPSYSMDWIWPLRPSRYLLGAWRHGQIGRLANASLWPVCAMVDLVAFRKWRRMVPVGSESGLGPPLDASTFLSCIPEVSGGCALRPEYDPDTAEWLWARLLENTDRGRLRGNVVVDAGGRSLGGFLVYVRRQRFGEVVFLGARPGAIGTVLDVLFGMAMRERLVAVGGRLDARFLSALLDRNCIFKRGCWGLVHARDPDIMQAISAGDAAISGLEGELWLRSPMDLL
ncbi:MAG: hypothetical protein QUV05_16850 [Phycisphaerae bacterium]|nr:hypothetical protein [Phycisphaerae bacterium]